jgi:hypothetical protein
MGRLGAGGPGESTNSYRDGDWLVRRISRASDVDIGRVVNVRQTPWPGSGQRDRGLRPDVDNDRATEPGQDRLRDESYPARTY